MSPDAPPGTVYLAGAGPGDPDLLTRKVHRLIDTADVVLSDSLVSDAVLDLVPPGTRVRDVGKRPGPDGERTTQEQINDLLVDHARAGETVLRLKGGDPTVFGRGGEEAAHLAEAGVPHEFVPGVSSVLAAPQAAGIPLTHRSHASSLTVVTGREDPTKDDSALDWPAIVRSIRAGGTLVVLMGVGPLPTITAGLQDLGLPGETPAATVQDATLASQETVVGTVATIADRACAADIEPPATTIVGDVVNSAGDAQAATAATSSAETPPRSLTPAAHAVGRSDSAATQRDRAGALRDPHR